MAMIIHLVRSAAFKEEIDKRLKGSLRKQIEDKRIICTIINT